LKVNGKELALALLAMAIPIVLADFVLKAMQLPKSSARTLLLAGSSLSSGAEGYRRYQSNRSIETSAVYGSEIAYRFASRSNRQGLISATSIQEGKAIDLAIVGDSYAEGQGGYPWVAALQRSWLEPLGVRSLNYAVGGSGFEDFAVAAGAAKRQFNARKLLVLFIEHDAYRPYQRMASNKHCSFYSNGALDSLLGPLTCSLYGVVWHHVPPGLSNAALVRESLARQHYGVLPSLNQLIQNAGRVLQRPATTAALSTTTSSSSMPQLRFGALPAASTAALKSMAERYGQNNVLLVQLPDQSISSMSAGHRAQQQRFRSELTAASGLVVLDLSATCALEKGDFHELDNHPNSSGYRRLEHCLRSNTTVNSFVSKIQG